MCALENPKKKFNKKVKGKVVISFAFILCALVMTFVINRVAFQKITSIIEDLSQPNEKLIALTHLHRDVTDLMDLQRIEAMEDKSEPSDLFVNETKSVQKSLDTLRILFADQEEQLKRVNSVDSLMSLRNKLFLKYLKVRYNFVKKGVLDKQLKTLSAQIDNQNLQIDSNVVTTEKSYKTTTIIPAQNNAAANTKKKWFSKKSKEVPVAVKPQIIVEEKTNVKVDTLAIASRDSILINIEKSLLSIETDRNRTRKYVKGQELILIQTNDLIVRELLNVIRDVENQEVRQMKLKNGESMALATQSLGFTRTIMVIFLLVALVMAVMIISDMVKINRYRYQLEMAKNEAEYHSIAKQRFLANMSHEIRTPLQSILGYAEQLSDKEQDENVKAIYSASKHLLQVVNEVLDYSRIISGKFTFENKVFNLQETVREVWKSVQLHAKKLDLQLEMPEENIYLVGDDFRLKQVLHNLLGNAVKFTEEGSIILTVRTYQKQEGLKVRLDIRDTGRGMSPEDLALIFNQFEQAQNTQLQSGTGLGLSIVKELVEAQGGEIFVKSKLGEGSVFTCIIQYLQPEEKCISETVEKTIDTSLFEGKVWVVDDDALILKLCEIIFTKRNIPYEKFSSAENLLAATWEDEVRIIFADVRLPGMSGIEMTGILRERKIDIPIVALTAQVLPEEQETLLQSGYSALLTKPFTEHQLLAMLLQHIENTPAAAGFTFDELKKMITDPEDLRGIIRQFKTDSVNDLVQLEQALSSEKFEESVLLVHRLAGRLAQMGASEIAQLWRSSEMNLRHEGILLPEIKEQLLVLIHELQTMLQNFRADQV